MKNSALDGNDLIKKLMAQRDTAFIAALINGAMALILLLFK